MIRYSDNLQGLLTCYAFALPFSGKDPAGYDAPAPLGFAGNVVLGDLASCAVLFGLHGLLLTRVARRRPAPVPVRD
jgi:hypothetical protein